MKPVREIGIVGVISVLFAFWFILMMAGLGGCAHEQPKPYSEDTPQYLACLKICEAELKPFASVLEDAETIDCECRKAPEPPPEGT